MTASRLAVPEVSAALSAARRVARLDELSERTARRAWSTYRVAIDVVELTSAVAADAADLARRFPLGGAEAVHLASARTLRAGDPILVSWDRRLSAAALEAGLSIAPGNF